MMFYMNLYLQFSSIFYLLLCIMLYKVILTFESVDEILWCDHMKTTEQYLPLLLFIIL